MSHVIVKLPRAIQISGLSRARLYEQINKGTFPKPVKLGARSVGWLQSEIIDWLDRRVEEREAGLEVFSLEVNQEAKA